MFTLPCSPRQDLNLTAAQTDSNLNATKLCVQWQYLKPMAFYTFHQRATVGRCRVTCDMLRQAYNFATNHCHSKPHSSFTNFVTASCLTGTGNKIQLSGKLATRQKIVSSFASSFSDKDHLSFFGLHYVIVTRYRPICAAPSRDLLAQALIDGATIDGSCCAING